MDNISNLRRIDAGNSGGAGDADTAAGDRFRRCGRYTRGERSSPLLLTPQKRDLLRYLAVCRLLSLPQLAALACPSLKSARRHMRELFDAGLVDVIPVTRAALAEPDAPNDATLLYGSAPNLYVPTRAGLQALFEAGLVGRDALVRAMPTFGPRNGVFVAHQVQVRDVFVWLERAGRADGVTGGERRMLSWRDGAEAALPLAGVDGIRSVRPDARFVYQVGPAAGPDTPVPVMVGLVEIDRATERGETRWREKAAAYGALFSGGRLREAVGYANARVLVITPTAARRDRLADLLAKIASASLASRFWLTTRDTLASSDLRLAAWRQAGTLPLQPLISLERQT